MTCHRNRRRRSSGNDTISSDLKTNTDGAGTRDKRGYNSSLLTEELSGFDTRFSAGGVPARAAQSAREQLRRQAVYQVKHLAPCPLHLALSERCLVLAGAELGRDAQAVAILEYFT